MEPWETVLEIFFILNYVLFLKRLGVTREGSRVFPQFVKLSLYFGSCKSVCLSVCPQSQGNPHSSKIWSQTAPDVDQPLVGPLRTVALVAAT